MHLSLVPMLSQKLELRQELEQRLEQRLRQQQKLEISLGLYLEQEDFTAGLVRMANSQDWWKTFKKDGFEFRYVAPPVEHVKGIVEKTGPGWAHCVYNPFEEHSKGEWIIFIVPDMIPEGLEDFVALHERGEELSRGNHYFASKLEFAYVGRRNKIRDYTKFIDSQYPSKFIDLTQEVHFPILPPELRAYLEEQEPQHTAEIEIAEKMIADKPIPTTILRKMVKYDDAANTVQKRIDSDVGKTQQLIWKEYNKPKAAYSIADIIDERLSKVLRRVKPNEAKAIARHVSLQNYAEAVLHGIYDQTHRHVQIEQDFLKAYSKVQKGERIVEVMKTVEDGV